MNTFSKSLIQSALLLALSRTMGAVGLSGQFENPGADTVLDPDIHVVWPDESTLRALCQCLFVAGAGDTSLWTQACL